MNLQNNYDLWLAENESKEWQNVQPLSTDKLHADARDSANNPIN
jgi:plasmid maintenance system antidote protein VapI